MSEEFNYVFRFKLDIRINKHEMGSVRIAEKGSDTSVSGFRNNGVGAGRKSEESDVFFFAKVLQVHHRVVITGVNMGAESGRGNEQNRLHLSLSFCMSILNDRRVNFP